MRNAFFCLLQVYKGYVDDPRNTDNAWMETVAVNFHDDTGINNCEDFFYFESFFFQITFKCTLILFYFITQHLQKHANLF